MSTCHCHSSPSNPTRSSKFNGYQIKGLFPTGSRGLGMLEVRSVIRDPPPTAITTAWNSIFRNCKHRKGMNNNNKKKITKKVNTNPVLTIFIYSTQKLWLLPLICSRLEDKFSKLQYTSNNATARIYPRCSRYSVRRKAKSSKKTQRRFHRKPILELTLKKQELAK